MEKKAKVGINKLLAGIAAAGGVGSVGAGVGGYAYGKKKGVRTGASQMADELGNQFTVANIKENQNMINSFKAYNKKENSAIARKFYQHGLKAGRNPVTYKFNKKASYATDETYQVAFDEEMDKVGGPVGSFFRRGLGVAKAGVRAATPAVQATVRTAKNVARGGSDVLTQAGRQTGRMFSDATQQASKDISKNIGKVTKTINKNIKSGRAQAAVSEVVQDVAQKIVSQGTSAVAGNIGKVPGIIAGAISKPFQMPSAFAGATGFVKRNIKPIAIGGATTTAVGGGAYMLNKKAYDEVYEAALMEELQKLGVDQNLLAKEAGAGYFKALSKSLKGAYKAVKFGAQTKAPIAKTVGKAIKKLKPIRGTLGVAGGIGIGAAIT